MLYDIGLIVSVAMGGWLALDVAMAETWRRRSIALGVLGATGGLWSASELLLRVADAPIEFAMLRRLLYFSVSTAIFSWFWVSLEADAPRWFRKHRHLAFLAAIPLAGIYSCMWWAPDGTVVALYSKQTAHGPLWIWSAVTGWALMGLGLFHFVRATLRVRKRDRPRAHALAAGISLPLVMNVAYAAELIAYDPAPCLLGPAALLIRLGVVDLGLTGFLPLARKDIVEQLEVGVVVSDMNGRILDANASARRLLGGRDLRGEPLDERCAELPETVEVMRFPLSSHAGHPGTATVLTDRREAIEAEQRLQLAGRLEAVGSLTAGIAHEVNNPLAYICANLNTVEKLVAELDRLARSNQLDAPLQPLVRDGAESLADAQEGFQRISLLVARLKGFARQPQAGKPDEPVDLRAAAAEAASIAGVGLAENAIRVVGTRGHRASGSTDVVTQILLNLIINAVQASEKAPEVEIDIARQGEELEVRVADRGSGLDPETIDQIFDPFFTTKPAGSGLGLGISFDLAQRLGGRLEAANRDGGGAVFTLVLPALQAEKPAMEAPAA